VDHPNPKYQIYSRGELTDPVGLETIRAMIRSGSLAPAKHIVGFGETEPRKAVSFPHIRVIFQEEEAFRLVGRIYKHIEAGRLRMARHAAARLLRLAGRIPDKQLEEDAGKFLNAVDEIRHGGGLARGLACVFTVLGCLVLVAFFIRWTAAKASQQAAVAQEGIDKAIQSEKLAVRYAELQAACHLLANSPHVRLARAVGVGPARSWLDDADRQLIESAKTVSDSDLRRRKLAYIRARAEKRLLDGRFREAMELVKRETTEVKGDEAADFSARMSSEIRHQAAEYFMGKANEIRETLARQEFEEARKLLGELEGRLVEDVRREEFVQLAGAVARAEQATKLLAEARSQAQAGKLAEAEATLKKLESAFAEQARASRIAGEIVALRRLARDRAKDDRQNALERKLAALVSSHRYAEGLKLLKEAGKDALIAAYAERRAEKLRAEARASVTAVLAGVRLKVSRRDYAGAARLIKDYGKTGLADLDSRLEKSGDDIVAEARGFVAESRGRAEKLAIEGRFGEARKLVGSIGAAQYVADVQKRAAEAVAFVDRLVKGYTFIKHAANFEKSDKLDEAEDYLNRALKILPDNHVLADKARRALHGVKRKRGDL